MKLSVVWVYPTTGIELVYLFPTENSVSALSLEQCSSRTPYILLPLTSWSVAVCPQLGSQTKRCPEAPLDRFQKDSSPLCAVQKISQSDSSGSKSAEKCRDSGEWRLRTTFRHFSDPTFLNWSLFYFHFHRTGLKSAKIGLTRGKVPATRSNGGGGASGTFLRELEPDLRFGRFGASTVFLGSLRPL